MKQGKMLLPRNAFCESTVVGMEKIVLFHDWPGKLF